MSSAEFEQGEEGFCGLFETFDDVPEISSWQLLTHTM